MTTPSPFGKDYEEAHMSRIDQSQEIINKMVEWMKNPNNIFYFCGRVGNGKTYFAAAFYNFMIENGKNIRAFTEPKLFSHLLNYQSEGGNPDYEIERLCECDYFILDDMGSDKSSEWKQKIILSFINFRSSNNLATLITSNLTRSDVKENYHERIYSRLFSNKNIVVEVNGSDRRMSL